jgi:hypothetical protein
MGKKILKKSISNKNLIDSGMILIITLLIFSIILKNIYLIYVGIIFLIINMTIPIFFYPFAFIWFGLSLCLSKITSNIVLSIIYILILTPVGLLRRIIGKDNLQLKKFKKSKDSNLITRDHRFLRQDLEKPY